MKLLTSISVASAVLASTIVTSAESASAKTARNFELSYDPVVTCKANYRQAPYKMNCWSEELGKETTIGEYVDAIQSGRITR